MILQLQRRRLEQAQELRVILENVSSEPALDVRAVFVKRLVSPLISIAVNAASLIIRCAMRLFGMFTDRL